ncbi:HGGxSTG domain-containing protein [Bradyrhizobium sp. 930_D9_N1_4]|uniref:HGGxSTG domain-containing protein n=1 Tax=Bradyrhizobium sp. 930_D9_N1_4 TaxID=3240374 RepID=UPI003F8A983A
MRVSLRCGAKTRDGGTCRAPAMRGKVRCRMHGGAERSGAPRGNQNARKHGAFTQEAIFERRQVQAVICEARILLDRLGRSDGTAAK